MKTLKHLQRIRAPIRSFVTMLTLSGLLLDVTGSEAVTLVKDLSYKPNGESTYERDRCKLDLYLPKNRNGFPTLLWFHGGSLKQGEPGKLTRMKKG